MKYAAVYHSALSAPPFSDAPMEALGVWTRLAAAAAALETDTLPFTKTSSARTLLLGAGVSIEDIEKATDAGLCRWDQGGLFVVGYDYHGQRVVESKRANGARGGRPRKSPVITGEKNLPVKRTETETKPPSLPFPSLPLPSQPRSFGSDPNVIGAPPIAQVPIPGLASVPSGEDQTLKVPRGPAPPPAYPQAFEAVWVGTGRRGTKDAAFRAWKKAGGPEWGDVAARWGAYMLSDAPAGGFVQHLSTWINGKGHLQDWLPSRRPVVKNGAGGALNFHKVTAAENAAKSQEKRRVAI